MTEMRKSLLNFYIMMRNLTSAEDGQDLVEYALVVALIAFAATAGMNSLASALNNAFTAMGTSLTNLTG
jgi:pilus assembly protein Flp/PilA